MSFGIVTSVSTSNNAQFILFVNITLYYGDNYKLSISLYGQTAFLCDLYYLIPPHKLLPTYPQDFPIDYCVFTS